MVFLCVAYGFLMSHTGGWLEAWEPEAEDEYDAAQFTPLWDKRGRFQPDGLIDLPEPAQRYLLHTIAPGTLLASSVDLRMHGEIKFHGWRRFAAQQIIHANLDFVSKARIHVLGLNVPFTETVQNGKGARPSRRHSGRPHSARSTAGRAMAQSVWMPPSLCNEFVVWTAISEPRPHVHICAHGEWAELALQIGADGSLCALRLFRWSNAGGGRFRYVPYGGMVEDEDTFGGYTIPTKLRLGYFAGTDRFAIDGESLRVTVDDATFF
jgi:hypothetical protein